MKTKYILHGGFVPQQIPEDDVFYTEILKNAGAHPKILLVYFAKEDDRIPKNRDEDVVQFKENKGEQSLSFEVANENDFPEQVQKVDIVYLHGGRSSKIIETLSRFPNLRQMFEGKIVVGDSAGANALSSYYYDNHDKRISDGLAILPIKLFCHYSKDWETALHELEKYHPDLEVLALADYQTKILGI